MNGVDPGAAVNPMLRAIEVARHGLGRVSPNPPVGAVAVRDGVIIGEGWHGRFGGPHAERDLISKLTERLGPHACSGCDLYVTLEPCAHQGKTPPCTDAVIEAGFARVFVGCDDPNPETSGIGYARLAEAEIEVIRAVEEPAARALIAGYLSLRHAGRPIVTAKWAMTLDGRIATVTGDARWISSEETRGVTRAARGTVDAILVGRGTVEADDPALTARTDGVPDPIRVVLDSTLKIDPGATLVTTARETPTIVIASTAAQGEDAVAARADVLRAAGVSILFVEPGSDGRPAPPAVLAALGERGIAHLLAEGGAEIHAAFFAAGCVDRVQVIVAPKVCGGATAPGPVGGEGIAPMAEAIALREARWRAVGEGDLLLDGVLTPAGAGEWGSPPT